MFDVAAAPNVWTIDLRGVRETEHLARQYARTLGRGSIVCLSGDLGSGKTVFARALIRALGDRDGIAVGDVPSPTYTLVQPYEMAEFTVYHFDLYRLSSPDEAFELAIDDAFADGVSVIEWAERIEGLLPGNCLHIHLDFVDDATARRARVWSPVRDLTAVARDVALGSFLSAEGWADARRDLLASDASFRTYDRIRLPGRQAVLMDSHDEKHRVPAFLKIARLLDSLGLSTPRIFAEDLQNGLVLLEDFGDDTFTRLLDRGSDPEALYNLATDALVTLHKRTAKPPQGIPCYSDRLLLEEAELFTLWYVPAVIGKSLSRAALGEFIEIWQHLLPLAREVPTALVLRDYHVDNLIRLNGRPGSAACGVLDFQDAVIGPVSYDFVSLVEDARRDVPLQVKTGMRNRYLAAFPQLDAELFDLSCAILGAQRHCKVLGIFTRLRDRDGKRGYLDHVPRLWHLLEAALRHPALESLRHWLDHHVPLESRILPPPRTPT